MYPDRFIDMERLEVDREDVIGVDFSDYIASAMSRDEIDTMYERLSYELGKLTEREDENVQVKNSETGQWEEQDVVSDTRQRVAQWFEETNIRPEVLGEEIGLGETAVRQIEEMFTENKEEFITQGKIPPLAIMEAYHREKEMYGNKEEDNWQEEVLGDKKEVEGTKRKLLF